jgi:hypothetical protein
MAHRLQESQAVVAKALLPVQTIGQQLIVQARRMDGASGMEACEQPKQQQRGLGTRRQATGTALFPPDSLTVWTARVDALCS